MAKATGYTHPNIDLYGNLMEFTKWRISLVQETARLVRAKKHYLDSRSAAEFCLLQLRYCCELLAIGCIAIHTDIPQASKLQTMWNAEAIMKAFGNLKPRFFPEAISDKKNAAGIWVQELVSGALSKAELSRMYNLFGGLLHTGTFKGYKNPSKRVYDFHIINDFVGKLMKLLNTHVYYLRGDEQMIRVIMFNEKDGRVGWNLLEKREISRSTQSR